MTPPARSGSAPWADALLALVSAAVLAWVSGSLFEQSEGVMLKWLPNVAAVILFFHRRNASLAAFIAGHAAGLALTDLVDHGGFDFRLLYHVSADVAETLLVILAIRRFSGDGRIRRSGDIARIAVFGMVVPAACSATIFALGLWAEGRTWLVPAQLWFTASLGVATIVLVPWLVVRGHVDDRPLEDLAPAGRRFRMTGAAVLLGVALAMPFVGGPHEDALVALLVLMASTWFPLRTAAVIFGVVTALHDTDLRTLFAISPRPEGVSSVPDALRLAAIVVAALYVRLLIAESRSASAAATAASRQLAQANQSLDELAVRHRLALTAGGIGVWETRLDTGDTDWDDTMFRLFGSDPGEGFAPRTLMRARLTPESLAKARAALAGVRRGDEPPDVTDYTLSWPDGTTRRIRTVVARLEKPKAMVSLVGASWDCSMEYLAAETMKARNEELAAVLELEAMSGLRARGEVARAQAEQNDLVANVSHELRTPLHAILGFLDLAQEDLAGGDRADIERAGQRLDRSRQAAKRLLAQVDDLLDLAKLESGTLALRKRRLELPELVGQIVDEMGPILKARQQRIVVARPQMAGSGEAARCDVDADEHRLMQVFRNLLANAARFSPHGGTIDMTIRCELSDAAGPRWIVDVRDEGPGIAEADLESVFAKFVQVRDGSRKSDAGTGLGLTIARQIARAHGGELSARASSRGAWFELKLPTASQD